jgi:ATP-dependent RNA helicase RhlE
MRARPPRGSQQLPLTSSRVHRAGTVRRGDPSSKGIRLTDFTSLGLADSTCRAVASAGYTTPTDIQQQAIPAILDGADVIGSAQTGTGKTAAFVLPMLDRLAAAPGKPAPNTCKAIVLAPTRELAQQIGEAITTYGRNQRLSHTVVVGGAPYGPQIKALRRGVDVVVATPGRLEDHMASGHIRLDGAGMAVLDEGDRMLDLGFMPAMERILATMPTVRQTVLFSATMPAPIRRLASRFLTDPREIKIAGTGDPAANVAQEVRMIPNGGKDAALLEILGGDAVTRSIVFTRTKRGADTLTRHLSESGIAAEAIHGDKSQGQRERTLKGFRRDKVKVLVATDVAARGIDVPEVSHVVNYDMPNEADAYVHRIGRTGRAGNQGNAISFCTPGERGLLHDIERLIGQRLVAPADLPPRPAAKRSGKPGGKPTGKPGARKGPPPRHARRTAA